MDCVPEVIECGCPSCVLLHKRYAGKTLKRLLKSSKTWPAANKPFDEMRRVATYANKLQGVHACAEQVTRDKQCFKFSYLYNEKKEIFAAAFSNP